MADRGWKRAERMAARDMGTERIPVTGERHGADFMDAIACYQLKVRRALPVWLFRWLDGIVATGVRHGKAGVLVLNRPHRRRGDALVILTWRAWCDLHGVPDVPDVPDVPEDADRSAVTPTVVANG